jgi:hypothetical protein
MNGKSAGLTLIPKRTAAYLAAASALLALGGYTGQVLKYEFGVEHLFGIIRHLDLNSEYNFATWYSASILFLCALLLWVIGRIDSVERGLRWWWAGLSLIFSFMAFDEITSLHERSMDYVRDRLHADGYLHFAWVVPGAAFALGVFLVYIPFLQRLPKRTRKLFLLSGGIYLAGALVMEMIGGKYASVHGELNLTFASLAHLEEAMELAGSVLFVYALLDFLRQRCSPLLVQFEPEVQLDAAPAPAAGVDDSAKVPGHFPATSS